jgi:hypothetical protein
MCPNPGLSCNLESAAFSSGMIDGRKRFFSVRCNCEFASAIRIPPELDGKPGAERSYLDGEKLGYTAELKDWEFAQALAKDATARKTANSPGKWIAAFALAVGLATVLGCANPRRGFYNLGGNSAEQKTADHYFQR